jgi:hypothetical protein
LRNLLIYLATLHVLAHAPITHHPSSIFGFKRAASKGLFSGSGMTIQLRYGGLVTGNNNEVSIPRCGSFPRLWLLTYLGRAHSYQQGKKLYTSKSTYRSNGSLSWRRRSLTCLEVGGEILTPLLQAAFQTLCRLGFAKSELLPGPGIVITV